MENLTRDSLPGQIDDWKHTNVEALMSAASGAGITAKAGLPNPVAAFSVRSLSVGVDIGVEADAGMNTAWNSRSNLRGQTYTHTQTINATIKATAALNTSSDNVNSAAETMVEKLGLEPEVARGYNKARAITLETIDGRLAKGSNITETALVIGDQKRAALLAVLPDMSPHLMKAAEALRLQAEEGDVFSVRYEFSAEAIERYNDLINQNSSNSARKPSIEQEANAILQKSRRAVSISLLRTKSEEAIAATGHVNKGVATILANAPGVNVTAEATAKIRTEIHRIDLNAMRDLLELPIANLPPTWRNQTLRRRPSTFLATS